MSYRPDNDEFTEQYLRNKIKEIEEKLLFIPAHGMATAHNISERGTGVNHSKLSVTSSGVSFPLLYEVEDLGTIGGASINLAVNQANGHYKKVLINGDVSLQITNDPPTSKGFKFYLEITQDGVGGRSITSVDTAVKNGSYLDSELDKTIGGKTLIQFSTLDGGVTWYAEVVGAVTEASEWSRYTAKTNVEMGGLDINNVEDIFADRVRLSVGTVVVNASMLTESATGNMIINVADTKKIFFQVNGVTVWDMSSSTITGSNIILSNSFIINDSVTDPLANGEFTRNGTHVKVFSGGALRNLSDIGGGAFANQSLSNLTSPTAINQDLLFGATGYDIGNDTNPVDNIFVNQVRLRTGSIVVNNAMITRNATDSMLLNVATGQKFFFSFNGVDKWDISSSSLTGESIILSGAIVINDSLSDPSANGEIRRNSTNLKVFTGGAVVNLSDLANKSLSNLTNPTSINQDLLFSGTGFDVGDGTTMVDNVFVNQLRLRTGSIVTNNAMITRNSTDSMILNVATGQKFFFDVNGVAVWSMSSSSLTGESIILSGALVINDSLSDPSANGEFRRNGTDVKVFTGGVLKNLSDIGAGGGNSISQLNSNVTVTDAGTGQVTVTVDGTLVATFLSGSLSLVGLMNTFSMAGAIDMNGQNITALVHLDFNTTGAVSSVTPRISASTTEMQFCLPTGDSFTFYSAGNALFRLESDGTLQWVAAGAGSAHRIDITGSAINILAENSGDTVGLWTGTSRSNATLLCQDLNSIFASTTGSTSAYELLIRYSNPTSTGNPAIGNLGFQAEDSANVFSAYVGFVTAIDDDTSTSRDGRFQIVVASANGTTARGVGQLTGIIMDGRGGNGTTQLAFHGSTPVAKATVTGSRGGNAALASLLTAMANKGLITDSSTA